MFILLPGLSVCILSFGIINGQDDTDSDSTEAQEPSQDYVVENTPWNNGNGRSADFGAHIVTKLDALKIDNLLRPKTPVNVTNNETDETVVDCIINILSIDTVTTKSFDISFVLRLEWEDPRLVGLLNSTDTNFVRLTNVDVTSRLWHPPVYFENAKHEMLHSVIDWNEFMTITVHGNISYSLRLQNTVQCRMSLYRFPFDVQKCSMTFGLFGYDDHEVILKWLDFDTNHPAIIYDEYMLDLEEYQVTDVVASSQNTDRGIILNYDPDTKELEYAPQTVLHLDLTLERRLGYHVFQTFIPTTAIVVVSFFSFWIDRNAVPGRVALGITCVLTMQTIASGLRSRLPPVSYYTAMDLWMIVCQAFVIMALLEYIFVHYIVFKLPSLRQIFDDYNPTKKQQIMIMRSRKLKRGNAIESASRVIFPLVFCIFLVVYFVSYMVL